MTLPVRLASACMILLFAVLWSVAQVSVPKQNPEPTTNAEELHSLEQIQAFIRLEPKNSKLYIQLGQAQWNAGQFPAAFDAFKQAVQLAPASAEAHNWMGAFLMGRGNLPDSISELRKAVSLDPKYARAYTNLGSALAKSGDLAGAVSAFQKALSLEPNSWSAHLNLGLALRENGDAAGALVHLRRVAQAQPKNPTLQCELGKTLRQNGDLSAAVAAFERALELDSEMREAYYGLGFTLKQQAAATRKSSAPVATNPLLRQAQDALAKGDLNSAEQQLLQVLSADDNDGDAHNLLGYILGQKGETASALSHLQRASALKPTSAEVHYNYGAALWYSGEKQKAISELKASIRLDPSAAASYALLGMAQRDVGDLTGSKLSLEHALALSPTTAATFIDLGIVFLQQSQPQRALAQFEAGLNANSAIPTPDWDGAISALRTIIAKGSDLAEFHNMLGLLLGRNGAASDEVLAEFRQALQFRPTYADAHNNMGLVLAQDAQDDKATAEFREAIRIRPDYADAHANLGAVLLLSDVEEAIGELEKAVSLDPSLITAQFNLAEAYGDSPTHGTAKQIEQLRKIISVAPDFARAHLALGKALLRDAKVSDAVAELSDATRLDPASGEAHYQLGLALARSGQQQEGAAEVKKGRELSSADERNQNAQLDISEGRAAFQKGELLEAEAKFRHAIRLQPNSPVAQHLLGVTLEKEGNTKEASAAYEKAVELNPGDLNARQNLARLKPPEAPVAQTSSNLAGNAGGSVSPEDDPAKVTEFEKYIHDNQYKEVEPLLASYVKEHPNSSWGWYALGYCQFAQKKLGESIQSLARSLSLNVKNADSHKILGRDLMAIGRFDAAQAEFEQAIRFAPNSSESHYDLGKLFSLQDNWIAARKQFEKALQLDPSYIEAIDSLGFAQEALGDDAAAVQTYQKAIALNEEHHGKFVAAHVNLSAFYNRTGDPTKALDYAQKALQLDGKSDAAWFQRARAEERQGQLQAAADSLTSAVALNPRSSSYYYVLSGIYRRLGKLDESKKALESFTRLDQENNELEKMRHNMSKSRNAPHPGGDRE